MPELQKCLLYVYRIEGGFFFLHMKIVEKPWGKEVWFACSEHYVGKLIYINKGHRLSRQYHRVKHETIYIDKGELLLEIGAGDEIESLILKEGDAKVIEPGVVHRMYAKDSDVRLIEVSTPQVDDVVRLEDDYGRVEA